MRECNMLTGQDIFRRNRWWSRVEYECGRVIRAHGPDIFKSSRRIDLIHSRLCNDAAAVTRFPETEGETMSEWIKVEPEAQPREPLETWRWAVGMFDYIAVSRTEEGWRLAVSIYHTEAMRCVPVDASAPCTEALRQGAIYLQAILDKINAMLAADSPQVDFPAAVDPVAAIERGEASC